MLLLLDSLQNEEGWGLPGIKGQRYLRITPVRTVGPTECVGSTWRPTIGEPVPFMGMK